MSSCTNGTGLCLPRASSFSPRLRIVAWSDTASIRKKLMYGGSQTSLSVRPRSPRPRSSNHSHEITSSKSLRVRPQTIPYRPKSGLLSGRPCSAPPPGMYNQRKKEPASPASGISMATLNLELPESVPLAKPSSVFQPKIPPKKQCPVWYSGEGGNKTSLTTFPGVAIPSPTPVHTQSDIEPVQKSFTESDIKRKIKKNRAMAAPKRDLHLSHRIAHLTQQINDCKQLARASSIVIR
ncbi:hypothetical protein ACHWQZ_G013742 [Mnemiopsis leidyi]